MANFRTGSLLVAIVACLALVVAAPASADPGAPGLHSSQAGVYPLSDVEGDQLGGGENPSPAESPAIQPAAAGGSGSSDPDATPANTSSLPFTGYVAGLVLALGAGVLLVGAGLRGAPRPRPTA